MERKRGREEGVRKLNPWKRKRAKVKPGDEDEEKRFREEEKKENREKWGQGGKKGDEG